jgi:hypothetical protein
MFEVSALYPERLSEATGFESWAAVREDHELYEGINTVFT